MTLAMLPVDAALASLTFHASDLTADEAAR